MFKELVDDTAVRNALKSFFQVNNLIPGNTVIVISETLVFYEALTVLTPSDLATEVNNFISYVPIPKDQLIQHVFVDNNTTHVVVLDKRLPSLVKSVLEEMGCKVSHIVPMNVFQMGVGDQISSEQIKLVIGNDALLMKSRLPFVTQQTVSINQDTPHEVFTPVVHQQQQNNKKQLAILAVSVVCLLSVSGYALVSSGFISNPNDRKIASMSIDRTNLPANAPSPTIVVPAAASPTSSIKTKDKLTIEVNILNMRPDSVGNLLHLLTQHGFGSIVQANDNTVSPTINEIQIGSSVQPADQAELKAIFTPLYPDIKFSPKTAQAAYDIIINVH